MRKQSVLLTTPFLGLLLTGLTSSGLTGIFPDLVRFFILFAAAAFLPGHVLRTRYLHIATGNRLFDPPFSFILGLSAVSVFTWFAMIAGISFSAYLILLQLALAVFYAVTMWRERSGRGVPSEEVAAPWTIASRRARMLYGLIALSLCAWFLVRGMPIDYRGDHYDHIGYIRAVALENDLTPDGVLAQPVVQDVLPVKADPRKGSLQPFLAAVSELAQIPPEKMWTHLPILMAPLVFLLFLSFTAVLLPSGGYRFACVVLFLLFYGGVGDEHLARAAYGQHLSVAYYWCLFVVCMLYARTRRPALLAAAAVLFWGGAAVHITVLPSYLLLVAAFVLFPSVFGFGRRERFRLAVVSIAVAGVVGVWKMATSVEPANLIHLHPQGLLYFTPHLFVVSPVEIIQRYGLIFLGGIVSLPFLFLIRSRKQTARQQLALAVLPVFLCFNPVLTPAIYDRGTYLVHRLVGNIPALHVAVLLLGTCIAWGRGGGFIRRVLATALVSVWTLLFVKPALNALPGAFHRAPAAAPGDIEQYDELQWFFRAKALEGTVVLSDAVTSYRLSALSGVKVVGVLHQHGNPNDPYAMDRLRAMRDVLSPFTSQKEALAAMERYGVDYVVCNGMFSLPHATFLGSWNPTFYDEVRFKFDSMPESLKNVLETPRIVVYRRTGKAPAKDTWYPTIPYLTESGMTRSDCMSSMPDETVIVRTIDVFPRNALPGEQVMLHVYYEKLTEIEFGLPLMLTVRFDHESLLESPEYPGDKYVRRFRERRSGVFRRFRIDHRPFGGLYAPDIWPLGAVAVETIPVDLPVSLKPGRYTVQIKLTRDSLVPNQCYRDFLYNDDGYTGVDCATLKVKEMVER